MISIALIDDEESSLRLMRGIVDWDDLGYSIAGTASDGLEGLELFQAHKPEVIIVDIRMPIMDGLEFIKEIRKTNAGVKIIILSAHGEFDYAQKAIDLGVSAYLLKPLNEEKLTEILITLKKELEKERSLRTHPMIRSLEDSEALAHFYDEDMTGQGRNPGDLDGSLPFRSLADSYLLEHQLILVEKMQIRDLSYVLNFVENSFHKFVEEHIDPIQVFEFCVIIEALLKKVIHKLDPEGSWEPSAEYSLFPEHTAVLSSRQLKQRLNGLLMEGLAYVKQKHEQSRNGSVIWKAKAYALQHFHDKRFSIQETAEFVGLSKSHFSKIYKEYTGENFWDFVIKLKMEKAKFELKNSNKTHYEIAQLIGYESEYHFSRIFTKTLGISPSQFRKTQQ